MTEKREAGHMRGVAEMAAAMAISGTIGWVVVRTNAPITTLVFWRCLFAAAALSPVCLALGVFGNGVSARVLALSALGGAAIVGNWLLLFAAFPLATVSIATAVYSTQPFILVALGAVFLGERVSGDKLVWLVIACGGVVAITQASPNANYVGTGYLAGVALAFGAAFLYAAAALLAKKLSGVPPHLISLIQVCVGVLALAPFAGFPALPTAEAWPNLAALGIVYTGLTFTLQYAAIQRLPTYLIGSLYFIYPLVAIVVDIAALGHKLQLLEVIGIAAMLVGTAGASLSSRRR